MKKPSSLLVKFYMEFDEASNDVNYLEPYKVDLESLPFQCCEIFFLKKKKK